MKKTIILKPYNHKIFYADNIFKINNGHNAFYKFDKFLKKSGFIVHTFDRMTKESSIYLYADMPYPWNFRIWLNLLLKRRSKHILLILESPIINPFNQWHFLQSLFDSVLSWNSSPNAQSIFIPQMDTTQITKKNKTKMIAMINANKNIPLIFRLFSLNYKNLYKKRVEAVEAFSRLLPSDFDVYGIGWNTFPVNKGQIAEGSKSSVLSQYRFSLCFENTIANGYVTEKIFDCFKSNVVPIYLGAPNVSNYIPENCFIDFRKFTSYTALLEYLQHMSEKEYAEIQKNIERFLSSKTYKKWSQDVFFNRLLKEIKNV